MGKGNGSTRASSSSNSRGLSNATRESGIQRVAETQMRELNAANSGVKAGVFTTRQGRDINLDRIASEGRADETWEKKPLTATPLAGQVKESNVSVLGEDRYRFTHGKSPSRVGQGLWMFRIGSRENGAVVEFPVISYADAKRAAKKIAAAYGHRIITVMT